MWNTNMFRKKTCCSHSNMYAMYANNVDWSAKLKQF